MKSHETGLIRFALILALVLALPAAAFAGARDIASVATSSSAITFYPEANGGSHLRVSGPGGFLYEEAFAAGATPSFDFAGLADGGYSYELRLNPVLSQEARSLIAEYAGSSEREAVAAELRAAGIVGEERTESGAFRILNGALVEDAEEARYTPEASGELSSVSGNAMTNTSAPVQVITMDLIVQGSECVGVDCTSSESFGFDTLRLKENNLRIKFDDTSNSGSFPNNDWQLTANETSNGGLNKFSIDDITGGKVPFTIEAGAPTNSLYVEADGDVGLNTKDPVVELHIVDGDTPTLRLEQNGSSGFTPQTWDIAGNETNFFVRDVTNGSKLGFKILPNAPENSLVIEGGTGDIGMGTNSPDARLELVDNAPVAIQLNNTASSGVPWRFNAPSNGSLRISDEDVSPVTEFELDGDGNLVISGALTTSGAACSMTPCDGVFADDYVVETIEEHAESMWENSYLPAIGPTTPDAPMNLSQKTAGILNELEKAHIYIEQLHERLARLEASLEKANEAK